MSESAPSLFERRLAKNEKHLRRWRASHSIEAWRLYDRDLREVPLVIDVYGEWAHVQRLGEGGAAVPEDGILDTERLAEAALERVLGIPAARVVHKRRARQKGSSQYQRLGRHHQEFVVREGGLEFWINLHDYLDTGLFLDHRDTRAKIREEVRGQRFLNLFCYTGSVTVYAAAGGASKTLSLDLSRTYLDWAERNLRRNGLFGPAHRLQQVDVLEWLERPVVERFDRIFLDPPTFSNSKRMRAASFDVQRDHVAVIRRCLARLDPGGELWFSNNHRRFRLDAEAFPEYEIRDLTRATLPKDFEHRADAHVLYRFREARRPGAEG